ncbi:hypothetical protein Bbelb_443780, partial [Branchiostoma belcheri]
MVIVGGPDRLYKRWKKTGDTPVCDQMKALKRLVHSVTISEPGVRKLLQNLNPRKAPGPDGLSPRLLRELAVELSPALTLLFQSSIETATVTPVYKKGERYRPENYRPISLTSIPCKIMEHIVTSTIMTFTEENDIICPGQHGFRRRHSCETQLLGLAEDISNDLEQGKQTDALIMDFSKAFDKVCHSLLIHKLNYFGITGQLKTWIQNFLTDRTHSGGGGLNLNQSCPCRVRFLLYINDLPQGLSAVAPLFADDTLAHKTICSTRDQEELQGDLEHLAKWEQTWLMEFHPKKCQSLHITRRRAPLNYHLHGHTLCSVKESNAHIGNIVNKASKTLGFLRRNLRASSKRVREIAYFTLVRPIVEYACPVWDPHPTAKDITRIEQVQRRAARWVTKCYRQTSSVSNMLEDLQWTSLQERRRLSRVTLVVDMETRPTPKTQTRITRHSHPCDQ